MSEQELAAGCQQQDNEARRALYERFAGMLFALCRRYAGSREEAEDLLHDNFLRVFSVIDRFDYRGEGSLEAWLRRVFVNGCLRWLEQQKKTAELSESERQESEEELADEEPPPEVPKEVILQLMGQLAPGYRAVLNLYLVEGWSHKEIAERLHIKESTSASQFLRARKILKEKIVEYLNTHDT